MWLTWSACCIPWGRCFASTDILFLWLKTLKILWVFRWQLVLYARSVCKKKKVHVISQNFSKTTASQSHCGHVIILFRATQKFLQSFTTVCWRESKRCSKHKRTELFLQSCCQRYHQRYKMKFCSHKTERIISSSHVNTLCYSMWSVDRM